MALCRLKALKKDLVLDLESDGDNQPEEQELTVRRLEKKKVRQSARAVKERTPLKKRRHSSTDESDEEPIEEHLSEKEQAENVRLQAQLAEEKKKNAQLQQLLTEKIDLLLAHFGIGGTKPRGKTQMSLSASLNNTRKEVSSPLAARSDRVPSLSASLNNTRKEVSSPLAARSDHVPDITSKSPSTGTSLAPVETVQKPSERSTTPVSTQPQVSSQGTQHQELPLFEDRNGQVHLGDGLFVSSEQWAMLMRLPRDSLFCKEGIRCLWTADDLQDRSVTGLVCRRFIRAEVPRTAKRPVTPVKLRALGRAYDHYIAHHPADNATPHQRGKKMNCYLAEFLQTYRRR
ncbi:uncharacterized protein LOC119453828 isoform X13 [Dermacentor silvarum]|uniref:uncharacterized protein LOC119453828 isoform X12 n=1 Tax=Dermacentor silvarum TaxID=543639 RepID=UPI0021014666|nr:uncharacterized protein LOC119453828 isoform X12 [Dermacentor silvarum]XP_049524533.1 uncharacterized protein LOC119453828 isoform X13 [Dermacentor silvarum]